MKTITLMPIAIGAAVLALGQVCAHATVVTLTFEGLQNLEPIDNYYNGGTGGLGSSGGPNYGISFTSDSLAIIAASSGGTGNFSGNPSGDTIAFFLSGAGDTMNVAAGFTTGFSFYYSTFNSGSVKVYSGLDGTGTLLATLSLSSSGNTGLVYDSWATSGVTFAGTAESAVFSGTANQIGFDNITLGSSNPVVPEPTTVFAGALLLLPFGIQGIRALSNRKQTPAA